jgi:sarcosine oxidase subunit gamma
VLERTSALARDLAAGGQDGRDGRRGLTLAEVRGWNLAQLAAYPGQAPAVAAAVAPIIGDGLLAASPSRRDAQENCSLYRIAPDAWWVVTREAQLLDRIAVALPTGSGAVTPLSHARTLIAVEGPAARTMLACGIGIDLHPEVFRVGDFAQTGLHHAGVLIERCGPESYQLYVLRTFAVATWQWLVDAALPFGYDIAPGRGFPV